MVDTSHITLSIVCIDPPQQASESALAFGVQDKSSQLKLGEPQADGSIRFECSIQVKRPTPESLDFAGPFVHGTPGQRFLYLSLGTRQNQQWKWIRRLKIPLAGITPQQVDEVLAQSQVLEAAVDGTRSGTVPLLNEGWVIAPTR